MKGLPEVKFPVRIPKFCALSCKRDGRPLYRLLDDFWVYVNDVLHIIPAGYDTDFASTPRGTWNLFLPYDPEYAAATIPHDFFYDAELYPRRYVDKIFLAGMRELKTPAWKRGIMSMAVRVGGTYKDHTLDSVMETRKLIKIYNMKRPLLKEPV